VTPFVRLFAGTGTLEFLSPGILLAVAVTCLAASLYLLLPKSGRHGKTSRRVGWFIGLITLGLFIATGQRLGNLGEEAVFLIVSLVAVVSAAATITCRSPVYAAIWFALCLAGVSGVGYLIILSAVLRKVLHQEEKIGMNIFRWLGNLLMGLTATYLYFMVVEWLTSIYTANTAEASLINSLLRGEYAWIFWASVAFLLIPLTLLVWQFVTKKYSISLLVLSGLLVNLAAIGKRFLVVVPSQTHGTMLPYVTGTYNPSWVEYGVIIGLMGFGALLFVLFMKIFPIMAVEED